MAVLFHIDLNAFFASAEIANNSALVGLPLVVSGQSRRSVICTASYEARAFGVQAAMPLEQALKLCPDLVVCEVNYPLYKEMSKKFFHFLRQYTNKIEPASIDECYMDVTEIIKHYPRPMDLAWEIQQRLQTELKLGCSIGIAPNRFLAKIASDLKKPLGITILRKSEIEKKLFPLPISAIQGIGKKSAPLLIQAGIETIGDLANVENENKVLRILGKHGFVILQNVRGEGSAQLNYNHSIQSISQSTTFEDDVNQYDELTKILKRLSIELSSRSKKYDVKGQLLSISIRYANFKTIARSISLPRPIDSPQEIYEMALLLLDRHYDYEEPLRHLGVALGSLQSKSQAIQQIDIFDKPKVDKLDLLNELNKQLSQGSLVYASAMMKEKNNENS